MLKLYRKEDSVTADAIEAEFRELVLGYDRVVADKNDVAALFGSEITLPVITNNEKVFSGEQIRPYIKELGQMVRDWQLFQGDYCYLDDNGETC